jgi:hypothetical protein
MVNRQRRIQNSSDFDDFIDHDGGKHQDNHPRRGSLKNFKGHMAQMLMVDKTD